jgi:thymidylate synthase
MAKIDYEYKNLLAKIFLFGTEYEDPNRKGTERIQIPFYNFEHNMVEDGFPAITTKKLYWKGVVGELIWFLRGDTNIKYLLDNDINIWDKDAYSFYLSKNTKKVLSFENYIKYIKTNRPSNNIGDLGEIYGAQWRHFGGHQYWLANKEKDQINILFKSLIANPFSTSHIVTAWNPCEINNMALPPCHFGFQIMCYPIDHKCDCSESEAIYCGSLCQTKIGFDLIWDQRSVDTFLGLPFNIASYALLGSIIELITGYRFINLRGSLRNVHLYDNQYDAASKQLERCISTYKAPKLIIEDLSIVAFADYDEGRITLDQLFNELRIQDFKLEGYESFPGIKVEMLERKNE